MNKSIDLEIKPVGNGLATIIKEMKEMQKQLSKATDVEEVKKLNKELEKTGDIVDDVNKSIDGFDLKQKFDDAFPGIAPLSSQLGELEDRMYQLAFAGEANSDQFRALQTEAIKMRQTIIGVDKQVDILADNQGLSAFGDGISSVGASLLRLDFKTASDQATTLANSAKKISFAEAMKSVKMLGNTFVQLGKAILTNPLFLIATVVGLIVVGIVKLLDKLGFLKVMFDAIGDAIGWVIQKLKDLLDWIGITDFASEDSAQRTIDRNNRLIKSEEKRVEATVDGLDHEIRMKQIAGEDTTKLERKRLRELYHSAKSQMEMNFQIMESVKLLHGAESDEFKEAMENAKTARIAFRETAQEIEAFDAQVTADKEKKNKEKEATAKTNNEEAVARAKQYAQDRLSAEREIEDLRISLIKDDTEREIAEMETKFNRLIEDTKKSTTLIESEKLAIIDYYGQQRIQAETVITQRIIDQEKAMNNAIAKLLSDANIQYLNDEEQILEEIQQLKNGKQQTEITAIQDEYFLKIEMAREHGLSMLELEEEQQRQIDEVKKKYHDEDVAREDAIKAKKIAGYGEMLDAGQNIMGSLSALNDAVMESQLAGAEGNEKKQEQIRKKAFERNKALQISMAVMSGIQGVINALTAQSVIPDPFGMILKAANAVAVGVTTVANIAKIKSTKYTGSGGGGGGTGTVGSAGGASAVSKIPDISLFGQSNDLNSLSSAKSVESTPTVKAVVVESDITQTQKRVRTIEERSAL